MAVEKDTEIYGNDFIYALNPVTFDQVIKDNVFLSKKAKFGSYTFYKGWFIRKKLFGRYDAIKAIDICWIYTIKTAHSVDFIPTGSSWNIILKTRKNSVKLNNEEPASDRKSHLAPPTTDYTFRRLKALVPWAVFGYSDYLKECWNMHNEVFLKAVDMRIKTIKKAVDNKKILPKMDGSIQIIEPITLPIISVKFITDAGGKAKRVYEVEDRNA